METMNEDPRTYPIPYIIPYPSNSKIPLNFFPVQDASRHTYKGLPRTPASDLIHSHKDIISVRTLIIYGAYLSTFLTCFFSISIASYFPMNEVNRNIEMQYISDGYQRYCGLSIIIFGISTMFTGMSQFIARCHMDDPRYIVMFSICIEIRGWFVVLGIQGTSMTVHHVALGFFLLGNVLFHWNVSADPTFGNTYYRAITIMTVCLSIVFMVLAQVITISSLKYRELRSISVSLEFFLSFLIALEQIFLIKGLDQFESIHLTFKKRKDLIVEDREIGNSY
jgi:hypothetical protein